MHDILAPMGWYIVPQPKTWDSTNGMSHSIPVHALGLYKHRITLGHISWGWGLELGAGAEDGGGYDRVVIKSWVSNGTDVMPFLAGLAGTGPYRLLLSVGHCQRHARWAGGVLARGFSGFARFWRNEGAVCGPWNGDSGLDSGG